MNICKLFKQTILLESKAVCFFRKFPAEGSEKIEEGKTSDRENYEVRLLRAGVQRAASPLCKGTGSATSLCGSRAAALPRGVLPATLHTGLLPDAKAQQNAASLPFPLWGKS